MQISRLRQIGSNCSLRGAIIAMAAASFGFAAIDAAEATPADTEAAATLKTAALSNVMIPMRDRTRLAADIYVPSHDGVTPAPGRFPVLLMRTPYGKIAAKNSPPSSVASIGVFTPEMANRQGYVVVYQDVRGTFDSEGVFEPMLNEGADGFDTVAWLGRQPWSNGQIGTFGPSYLGGTQMLLAAEQPPGLVTAFAQVAATDQARNDWVYMDGVLSRTTAWWTGYMFLGGPTAARLGTAQQEALKADLAASGLGDPKQLTPENFDQAIDKLWGTLPLIDMPVVRHAPWWREWLGNWNNPQHFQNNEMSGRFEKISVPILHLGGWYDLFLRNTVGNYKNIATQANDLAVRAAQRLVIGPWSHESCEGCPPNSTVDAGAMQLAWMDQWLKGQKTGLFDSPVTLYVMGENRWRAEDSWPLPGTQPTRYYLHSAGGANTAEGDGALSVSPPGKEQPDRFVYDPRNPAPTFGGVGLSGYRAVQNEAEARPDVLVYSTSELTEDVEVTGEVSATLYAASSARDTDWWMKLIDVAPDGKAYILSHGVVRARYRDSRTEPSPLTPGKIEKYSINMWATSNVFKKGHRIRVEVTSSNFPYADRNPNAFVDLTKATDKDFIVASQTVYHEGKYPSYVELPIIPQSRARTWIETPFPHATASATGQ